MVTVLVTLVFLHAGHGETDKTPGERACAEMTGTAPVTGTTEEEISDIYSLYGAVGRKDSMRFILAEKELKPKPYIPKRDKETKRNNVYVNYVPQEKKGTDLTPSEQEEENQTAYCAYGAQARFGDIDDIYITVCHDQVEMENKLAVCNDQPARTNVHPRYTASPAKADAKHHMYAADFTDHELYNVCTDQEENKDHTYTSYVNQAKMNRTRTTYSRHGQEGYMRPTCLSKERKDDINDTPRKDQEEEDTVIIACTLQEGNGSMYIVYMDQGRKNSLHFTSCKDEGKKDRVEEEDIYMIATCIDEERKGDMLFTAQADQGKKDKTEGEDVYMSPTYIDQERKCDMNSTSRNDREKRERVEDEDVYMYATREEEDDDNTYTACIDQERKDGMHCATRKDQETKSRMKEEDGYMSPGYIGQERKFNMYSTHRDEEKDGLEEGDVYMSPACIRPERKGDMCAMPRNDQEKKEDRMEDDYLYTTCVAI